MAETVTEPLSAVEISSPDEGLAMRFNAALVLCISCSIYSAESINGIEAQVYFSPNGGCTDAIVAAVGQAKKQIRVQAYSFTSTPIAKVLKEANERGVDVRVILDKSQRTEKYSGADFIAHAGIPVVIDEKPAIAHSKVMIIDGSKVITGSFNFTSAAENKNVENLLILESNELAALYLANWDERASKSVAYEPIENRK